MFLMFEHFRLNTDNTAGRKTDTETTRHTEQLGYKMTLCVNAVSALFDRKQAFAASSPQVASPEIKLMISDKTVLIALCLWMLLIVSILLHRVHMALVVTKVLAALPALV